MRAQMFLRRKPSSERPSSRYEFYTAIGVLALAFGFAMGLFAIPAFSQAGSPPTFNPQAIYSTPSNPVDIVRADFDRDGDLDLATAYTPNPATNGVSVFLNNGSGVYSSTPINFPLPP